MIFVNSIFLLVFQGSPQTLPAALDVCDAVALKSGSTVVRIEGVGVATVSGFKLIDGTCPAYSRGGTIIATIVDVADPSYADESDKELTEAFADEGKQGLWRITVVGRLYCRDQLSIGKAGLARGNGFGRSGTVRCLLKAARIESVDPILIY